MRIETTVQGSVKTVTAYDDSESVDRIIVIDNYRPFGYKITIAEGVNDKNPAHIQCVHPSGTVKAYRMRLMKRDECLVRLKHYYQFVMFVNHALASTYADKVMGCVDDQLLGPDPMGDWHGRNY